MTDLIIGNDTLNVEVAGEADLPALFLSHPLGTGLAIWDGQMAALTRRFRVIRADTRGHGGSALGAAPISIARLGGDVLAILDALDIESAHFVGLSLGGAIGMWLLANAPERINRAVLANTAPRLGTPDGWNARIVSVLAGGTGAIADAMIERWFSPDYAAREPGRVAAIRDTICGTPPQAYAACCAALRDFDLRETLRQIRNDVLVVTGRDDPGIPKAEAEAFIAGIPGARHVVLDARHLTSIEAENAFNTAVVEFLTAKAKPRPRAKTPTRPKAASASPPRENAAAKRGGAGRRSNAARSPLQKTATKRAPAKARAARAHKSQTAATRRRPAAKAAAARRSTAAKVAPAKKAPAKPIAKKAQAKTTTTKRAVTTRRAPPVSAARGIVEKPKRSKAAVKKTAMKKRASPSPAKKMPAPRRKSTSKPRRPTGRRKS